jgi:hypothetical protein
MTSLQDDLAGRDFGWPACTASFTAIVLAG